MCVRGGWQAFTLYSFVVAEDFNTYSVLLCTKRDILTPVFHFSSFPPSITTTTSLLLLCSKLSTFLPHKVFHRNSNAKWLADKSELYITLPLDKSDSLFAQ